MSCEPRNYHEDIDLFREALSFTQSETGFTARLIENGSELAQLAKQHGRLWSRLACARSAEMLRVDLAKAKIPDKTGEGVVDFHSLRVTYITNLARSGVHPKVAQLLARHSTMELTMKVYTKLNPTDVLGAVNAIFKGTNRAQKLGSKRNIVKQRETRNAMQSKTG